MNLGPVQIGRTRRRSRWATAAMVAPPLWLGIVVCVVVARLLADHRSLRGEMEHVRGLAARRGGSAAAPREGAVRALPPASAPVRALPIADEPLALLPPIPTQHRSAHAFVPARPAPERVRAARLVTALVILLGAAVLAIAYLLSAATDDAPPVGVLRAPASFSALPSSRGVELAWMEADRGPVPEWYEIYRRPVLSGDFGSVPIAHVIGTHFDDTSAEPCGEYVYRVVARTAQQTSLATADRTVRAPLIVPPGVVSRCP